MSTETARERWFARLHAERQRREDAELQVDGRNPREAFLERLDLLRSRLAPPDLVLTPSQEREIGVNFSSLLRELGYGRGR